MLRWVANEPTCVVGYEDECWWSRVKEPDLQSWSAQDQPLRLHSKQEAVPKGERKALSCYGLWLPALGQMLVRFVRDRPVSAVTEVFLAWVSGKLAAAGKRALFLVWDNASWHHSQRVRAWIKAHNRAVKAGKKKGVRLIVCPLPARSPWLNPIEPKWLHGKRAIAEPDEVLDELTLMARVFLYYDCLPSPRISTDLS